MTAGKAISDAPLTFACALPWDCASANSLKAGDLAAQYRYGHTKVKDEWVDPEFGKTVALAIVPQVQVCEVRAEQVFAKRHIANERAPAASSVREFGFESDRDLVTAVEGVSVSKARFIADARPCRDLARSKAEPAHNALRKAGVSHAYTGVFLQHASIHRFACLSWVGFLFGRHRCAPPSQHWLLLPLPSSVFSPPAL